MKIIRIWADTHSTGIFDSIGRFYDKSETTISEETWNDLQKWVMDYDYIIPMETWEREAKKKEILELDKRGLKLKDQIQNEWEKDVKTKEDLSFKYYSEGLLKEIESPVSP